MGSSLFYENKCMNHVLLMDNINIYETISYIYPYSIFLFFEQISCATIER